MTPMQKYQARLEIAQNRIADELQYEWDNGGSLEAIIDISSTVVGTCSCGNHILEMGDELEVCIVCQASTKFKELTNIL